MTGSTDEPVPINPEQGFEDLVSSLEALGARERAQMPEDLVDRTLVRTQSLLRGPAAEPVVRRFPLLRVAAVLALLASLGVLIVMQRPTAPGSPSGGADAVVTQAALDLDLLDGPDWDGDLDAEIAVLLAESTMLDGELDRDLAEFDLFSDEGAL